MNDATPFQESGYLVVKVSTARGAIPLENAAVTIRDDGNNGNILYSLLTDSDGKTPQVSLLAPDRKASEHPGSSKPYATYSVDVFSEGYVPLRIQSIPIFSSILSIQPAVMVPLPEESTYGGFSSAADHQPATLPYSNLREQGEDAK